MKREILALVAALSTNSARAYQQAGTPPPDPDYKYVCTLKEDFSPHGKVIGAVEATKEFDENGKPLRDNAQLKFNSASFLHDAFPAMADGYMQGVWVSWQEDQHKEIHVPLTKDSDRSAYVSPVLSVGFAFDENVKIPKKYKYYETIIVRGKNALVGKYKDGFTHFEDYYSPEVINLDRIEASEYGAMFRADDIMNYSQNSNELTLYFVKLSIEKYKNIHVKDRIILQQFSFYASDLAGIEDLYEKKIRPWMNKVNFEACEKVYEAADIIVTRG